MSTDGKALMGFLVAGGGVTGAAVADHNGQPYWPIFLVLPLVVAAVALGGRSRGDAAVEGAEAVPRLPGADFGDPSGFAFNPGFAAAPPPPPVVHESAIKPLPLPSAVAGYDFRFSANVCWSESTDSPRQVFGNPAALPVNMIVRRAAELVLARRPTEVAVLNVDLATALSTPIQDPSAGLTVWASDVALVLSEADSERLRLMAELRKDEELWERERAHEKVKRAYLGDDVLKSTGSAVVWALSRKEDAIERAVDLIGPLAQLSAAANDREVPKLFRHLVEPELRAQNGYSTVPPVPAPGFPSWVGDGPDGDAEDGDPLVPTVSDHVAGIADCLGYGSGDKDQTLLIANLVRAFVASGHPDEAEDLRRAFDRFTPPADEPAADDPMTDATPPDSPIVTDVPLFDENGGHGNAGREE